MSSFISHKSLPNPGGCPSERRLPAASKSSALQQLPAKKPRCGKLPRFEPKLEVVLVLITEDTAEQPLFDTAALESE